MHLPTLVHKQTRLRRYLCQIVHNITAKHDDWGNYCNVLFEVRATCGGTVDRLANGLLGTQIFLSRARPSCLRLSLHSTRAQATTAQALQWTAQAMRYIEEALVLPRSRTTHCCFFLTASVASICTLTSSMHANTWVNRCSATAGDRVTGPSVRCIQTRNQPQRQAHQQGELRATELFLGD